MRKSQKGFTLIELLLVVAIIGILSSLLIPNVMVAIQKSKQKSCMGNVMLLVTGCADYVVDHGSWDGITQAGAIDVGSDFVQTLYPYRLKGFPTSDAWGTAFNVYVGADAVAGAISGIPAGDCGGDDFLVSSYGRDGESGPLYTTYDPVNLEAGLYEVTAISDFDEDLVNWSGSWIICPRHLSASTGT
jgi:prepilin-type N-terminal cleavage/methylation domain-containing protein